MGNDSNERRGSRSGSRRGKRASESPFHGRRGDGTLGSFSEVPGVSDCLDKVTSAGYGLLVGVTRDGGAHSITLMVGEERHRAYASDQGELDQVFSDIIDFVISGE